MKARARRIVNTTMGWLTALSAMVVVLPLILILVFLVYQGASTVNLDFFTRLPKPVGEPGGGMANAIVGTLILVGLASCLGLPLGILGGVYLAESQDRRLPWVIRFLADVLNGSSPTRSWFCLCGASPRWRGASRWRSSCFPSCSERQRKWCVSSRPPCERRLSP